MFESAYIIGRKQFEKANELLHSSKDEQEELSGTVGNVFQWINMTTYKVHLENNETVTTCPAAMGYSFAAGTTDGPGDFNFIQGDNNTNPFWNFISNILKKPTEEQVACHAPKPILLDTGEIGKPYKVYVLEYEMFLRDLILFCIIPRDIFLAKYQYHCF